MSEQKKLLVDNLHKIWISEETNVYIKKKLTLADYNCLRSCLGYILDYRTIVQCIGNDFTVNFQHIWFRINRTTFELKGDYN